MYLKVKDGIAGNAKGISIKDTLLKPKGPFTTSVFVKKFIYNLSDEEVKWLKEHQMIEKFDEISEVEYQKYLKKYAEKLEDDNAVDTLSPMLLNDRFYSYDEINVMTKAEQIALLKKRKVKEEDVGRKWGKEEERINKILDTNPKVS